MQNKKLMRDMRQAKFKGVCAGLARFFGLEIWIVRLFVFGACFVAFPFVLFCYFGLTLVLDKDDKVPNQMNTEQDTANDEVKVKTKSWQNGQPPKQAIKSIAQRFDQIEQKIQNIESYVTSDQYQIHQKINRL